MTNQIITNTDDLYALCERLATSADYITVDTEFIRERTYWPRLCLVQLAGPTEEAIVDAMAPKIDLEPLFNILSLNKLMKVFHAARQDIETFHHLSGLIPHPIFDTQVAAMVCGFGENVSYETLVTKIVGERLDKSARFSNWDARPLTERQTNYALADVTHLRLVYDALRHRVESAGRSDWITSEMSVLSSPSSYITNPDDAWHKIRTRGMKPQALAILKELAAWREVEAQIRNVPRGRVIRDETIVDIANCAPTSMDELSKIRSIGISYMKEAQKTYVLEAVLKGLEDAEKAAPPETRGKPTMPQSSAAMVDMLRILLRIKCDEHDVASKLVASASDLEALALDDKADIPALSGWRYEIFGAAALDLKKGRIGLGIQNNSAILISGHAPHQSAIDVN